MTKIRSSPRKKNKGKVEVSTKTTIKKPAKAQKDATILELNRGDVALVVSEKESTLFLPTYYGEDDPIPEHMQLMCAMAVLFKNDPTFKKYIKKRWSMILEDIDKDSEEVNPAKPPKKITKRRKAT